MSSTRNTRRASDSRTAGTDNLWARPHLSEAHHQLTGIYRQIVENWVLTCATSASSWQVRKWAKQHPCLEGIADLPGLLDRIDAAASEETDEILLALIKLQQSGKSLAGHAVLQAMLPKLSRMAFTTATPGWDGGNTVEERRQVGINTFWEVMATYPVERRPRKVSGNLALDTLHQLTRSKREYAEEFPIDPDRTRTLEAHYRDRLLSNDPVAEDVATHLDEGPNPEGNLASTLAWAVDVQAISAEEASTLVRVYAPTDSADGGHSKVAASLGITEEALRARCSRATRKVIAAVRAHAEGGMVLPQFAS